MRKIRGALTYILKLLDCPVQIDPVPRRTGSSPEASLAITRPQSPGSQPLHISDASMADSLSLPSPDEVHALVEDYFATTGVLFPFVHKATFMEALVKAQRENFRALRRSWLGLLNIILAMATTTESIMFKSTSDRAARAEVFFSRSEALSIKQTMSGTTVETGISHIMQKIREKEVLTSDSTNSSAHGTLLAGNQSLCKNVEHSRACCQGGIPPRFAFQ